MTTRYLHLVRHGQYIKEGEFGEIDKGLTTNGRRQAKWAGKALRHLPSPVLYTSPRQRAMETAAIIGETINLDPQVYPDLTEIPMIAFGEPINEATRASEISYWNERRDGAQTTFSTFFQASENSQTEHVILVCHGNVIRYFMCRFLGIDVGTGPLFEPRHCGITTCVFFNDGSIKRLLSLNEVGHLPLKLRTLN